MAAPSYTADASEPSPTVATLRAGEEISAVFACIRKERRVSRAGSPFLDLELRDATGSIRGRAFRDADVLAGRFERGELVRVRGRVERFRDALEIALHDVSPAAGADAEPARFLPVAYRDLDELEGFLEHLSREVAERPLAELLERVLGDRELRDALRKAPCAVPPAPGRPVSAGVHHAYLGGLLEHTVAVATLALELCSAHPGLDRDLLVTAALVHDIGKTREFGYGAEIERTDEGRMLGHVELGLRLIATHAPASLPPERRLALEHCVLLHHGPDAAAGRRFRSAEALALHRLNALDASVKGALAHGLS
jgi:3'-5' exoribonuclease